MFRWCDKPGGNQGHRTVGHSGGWKLSLVAQLLRSTLTPRLSSLFSNNDCVLFKSTLGQPLSRRGSWRMPEIPTAKCNQLRHFQIVCDSDLHHHYVVFITIIINIMPYHYTCGHELAIAVRSWVRMIASVELSMSSREIFLVVEMSFIHNDQDIQWHGGHWGCLSHRIVGSVGSGRCWFVYVYQIYPPTIDTIVTGLMVATTRKLKMIITSNLPQAARKSVKPVREVCWGG